MSWYSELMANIGMHISSFDFSPPRTVDALSGWVALIGTTAGVIYAIYRWVRRALEAAIPMFKFHNTCTYMSKLRKQLAHWERSSLFNPRLSTVNLCDRTVEPAIFMAALLVLLAMMLPGLAPFFAVVLLWTFCVSANRWGQDNRALEALHGYPHAQTRFATAKKYIEGELPLHGSKNQLEQLGRDYDESIESIKRIRAVVERS